MNRGMFLKLQERSAVRSVAARFRKNEREKKEGVTTGRRKIDGKQDGMRERRKREREREKYVPVRTPWG